MILPADATIALEKITEYLLRHRDEDDKSKYLALAGYSAGDPERLLRDIRVQLLPRDAVPVAQTDYGSKYSIRGTLRGPNGRELRVISFWMLVEATGSARFLTLYPDQL